MAKKILRDQLEVTKRRLSDRIAEGADILKDRNMNTEEKVELLNKYMLKVRQEHSNDQADEENMVFFSHELKSENHNPQHDIISGEKYVFVPDSNSECSNSPDKGFRWPSLEWEPPVFTEYILKCETFSNKLQYETAMNLMKLRYAFCRLGPEYTLVKFIKFSGCTMLN